MKTGFDPIGEGLCDYRDEQSDKNSTDLYDKGRERFSFKKDSVPRGADISPEKRAALRQKYLDFLKRVYKQAGYADQASGRGDTSTELSRSLLKFEQKMAAAAKEDAIRQGLDENWYTGPQARGLPDLELLEKNIFPCLEKLADIPEDIDHIFEDALTCLEDLMITKFYASSSDGVDYSFYRAFFAINPISFSHKATNNFVYHYGNFGSKFAILIAVLQGKKEDEHYDGLSYAFRDYQLDQDFLVNFEKIPRQFHNDVLDVAINIAKHGGPEDAAFFLKKVPQVIVEFAKSGDPELLNYYFDLCRQTTFRISEYRDILASDTVNCPYSPLPFFLDGKGAVKQMQALRSLGRHQSAAMAAACFLLDCDQKNQVVFDEYTNSDSYQINFTEIINKFREAGKSEQFINQVLTLCQQNPWLGDNVSRIITQYLEYDKTHPGGVPALIEYLGKIKESKTAASSYTIGFKLYPWGHPEIKDYLKIGERVASAFPTIADVYFSAYWGEEKIKNICDNIGKVGAQRFYEVIDRLEESSRKFSALKYYDLLEPLLKHVFQYLITDPRLNDLLEAIDVMATKFADNGTRKDCFTEMGVINACEFLISGSVENWGDGGKGFANGKQEPTSIADVDMVVSAKILGGYLQTNGKISFNGDADTFALIKQGFDPRIALKNHFMQMRQFEQHYDVIPTSSDLNFILALQKEYGIAAVKELAGCVEESRRTIKEVFEEKKHRRFLPTFDEEKVQLPANTLCEQIERLDQVMQSYDCKGAKMLVDLRKELVHARQLIVFREMIKGATAPALVRRGNMGSDLLKNGSETTRIVVGGAALLLAIGAMELPGISTPSLPQSDRLQNLLLTQGVNAESAHELSGLMDGYYSTIQERVSEVIPNIERLILAARQEAPGLMPEGGKIHTLGTLNQDLVGYVQGLFGLDSTSFKLIHSGKTLLLPVAPTAFELQLLISILARFGVMDTESPDLQIAMGGRLPEKLAAISGISVMLSTDTGIRYAPGAFKTSHAVTGARIMAYDARVKVEGLPYDRKDAMGRTDMLGRRSLIDIQHYRVVHTLLTDLQYGGVFQQLGKEYVEDFMAILQKYGLQNLLNQTTWIFNPDRKVEADSIENHENVIAKVTEAWFKASGMVDFGLIGEMRRLIYDYYNKVKQMRETVIKRDQKEYERYLAF